MKRNGVVPQEGYVYRFPLWRLMLYPFSWKIAAKEPIDPPSLKEANRWRWLIMSVALLLPLYCGIVITGLDLLSPSTKTSMGLRFAAREIWSPLVIPGATLIAATFLNHPFLFLGSFARSKLIETWPDTSAVKSAVLTSLVFMVVPFLFAYAAFAYVSLARTLGAGDGFLIVLATLLSHVTGVVGYWLGYYWQFWRTR